MLFCQILRFIESALLDVISVRYTAAPLCARTKKALRLDAQRVQRQTDLLTYRTAGLLYCTAFPCFPRAEAEPVSRTMLLLEKVRLSVLYMTLNSAASKLIGSCMVDLEGHKAQQRESVQNSVSVSRYMEVWKRRGSETDTFRV